MTALEFKKIEPGDIVEIVDWPGFSNERMRRFIGRKCEVLSRVSPSQVKLTLLDGSSGDITEFRWSNRSLQFVPVSIDTDMKLLFE